MSRFEGTSGLRENHAISRQTLGRGSRKSSQIPECDNHSASGSKSRDWEVTPLMASERPSVSVSRHITQPGLG